MYFNFRKHMYICMHLILNNGDLNHVPPTLIFDQVSLEEQLLGSNK